MAAQKEILAQIASAEAHELSRIVQAVLARYDVLFPEDEVFFLSLPTGDRAERAAILRQAADLIESQQ